MIDPPSVTARELPEEVPVAIVCDGTTLAVLMCTPADLVDFARGFLLTEGIVERAVDVDVHEHAAGIECRVRLGERARHAVERRRRTLAATSACGLCGVKSLAQAVRPPASVGGRAFRLAPRDVTAAVDALRLHQPLHDRTRGVHAAGFFVPGHGMRHVREDVGRHNALDKLAGAVATERADGVGANGAVVLTSRVSIEMVQKSAAIGAPVLVAVSTPTTLAVRAARAAGLTLIGNVRGGRHEVFTEPFRVSDEHRSTDAADERHPRSPGARPGESLGGRPDERPRTEPETTR